MQAFKSSNPQSLSAPNGTSLRVYVPPNSLPLESKRAQLIENAEDDLEKEMEVLQEGTRNRNLEVQDRLDEIRNRGNGWKVHLRKESEQMELAISNLRRDFQKLFKDVTMEVDSWLHTEFSKLQHESIPPEDKRELTMHSKLQHFVGCKVPNIIEMLQGSVTRRLKKSHETFDIDNTKLMKREKKILDRFESHVKHLQGAFLDENRHRKSKFIEVEEDILHSNSKDDWQVEKLHSKITSSIMAIKHEIAKAENIREKDDLEILEQLTQAMLRLQSNVLTNFGMQEEI